MSRTDTPASPPPFPERLGLPLSAYEEDETPMDVANLPPLHLRQPELPSLQKLTGLFHSPDDSPEELAFARRAMAVFHADERH